MRIIDCLPRSEAWERLRHRPTASEFGEFCTPTRGDYSASATDYACKIISKRRGLYVETLPTEWMEWGVENEPAARARYEAHTGYTVVPAGFILPDHTDAYGGSPDGLVGDDGLVEIKSPAPWTLMGMIARGKMPVKYRPQIQGLLMISGRKWCDFWADHPELPHFRERVEADEVYQAKIAKNLLRLLEEIDRIEQTLRKLQWKPESFA